MFFHFKRKIMNGLCSSIFSFHIMPLFYDFFFFFYTISTAVFNSTVEKFVVSKILLYDVTVVQAICFIYY